LGCVGGKPLSRFQVASFGCWGYLKNRGVRCFCLIWGKAGWGVMGREWFLGSLSVMLGKQQ